MVSKTFLIISCIVCWLLISGVSVIPTLAQVIPPGIDIFETEPGTTSFGFGTDPLSPPLPADFFGPGSDPFDGVVAFAGDPFGSDPHCSADDLTFASTLVARTTTANILSAPSSDIIDIEIVALSLVSTDPITVTYNGGLNPELWDVAVELSVNTQPTGQMTITRTHANGGTFDSVLFPIIPKFIFTRASDAKIVELDFGLAGFDPVIFEIPVTPWEEKDIPPGSCTSNWCPSPLGPFVLSNSYAAHGVRSICPGYPPGIPALSPLMMVVLALLLIATGIVWMRKRAFSV